MQIEFIGAAHEVTGSCHFVRYGDRRFLVDCGMEQGADLYENQKLPVEAGEIDYIFVTHAHIDHSGLIPLMAKSGFRGHVFATRATTDLCGIMLRDSAHIQESEAEWKNRKAERSGKEKSEPMYTLKDAEEAMTLFTPCPYDEIIEIDENLKVRFVDAGHLLGSASIEFWIKEGDLSRKLVFSGDIGQGNKPLIRKPTYLHEADYVIMESTYGDRVHEAPTDYAPALADVIRRTFARGGNLVIPAFSVGRTQEMLYFLRRIKTEKLLPEFADFEVYIDSPLAIEATNIFNKSVSDCFSEEARDLVMSGVNPIGFDGLKTAVTADDSKNINFIKHPIVIISASGMCEAGRIRHHLKHNLWRPECTILFVGYQVPGTIGNKLLNGAKDVKLFGESIQVAAEILKLPGLSGHADRDKLTEWAGAFKEKPPKGVFIVHGEDKVTEDMAAHLHETFGYEATAPFSGDTFDLETGIQIESGARVMKKKKSTAENSGKSTVFRRLMAAGERLMAVIRRSEGRANKDLGKFADQIEALADKWEK